MTVHISPLPCHWTNAAHRGRGDSWTLPAPGPHRHDLPPPGFTELSVTVHLRAWTGERCLSPSRSSSHPQHNADVVTLPTEHPCQRPGRAASLGREVGKRRRSPTGRLTFSLLLGDHWRWLRKGLAYLTIGSRVGGCWRAKEKRQEQETVTVTRRGTG